MPAQLVWLVLVLGVVVLAACWFMPREVGKEDEPIVNVRVDLPSIEEMSARMHDVRLPFRRGGAAASRATATELPPSETAPAAAPPEPTPSPMGAPQPVLSQDGSAQFALPGGGSN
jgi:hypothetical protein